MEDLNNRQIVLLTMFVSFVISIATGIITVAMLQEAPPTLTQTVNHVVEHTIERVVNGTTTAPTAQTVSNVTKEVTVYAKEDDLVVAAVEKNQPRMALIYSPTTGTSTDPIGIGFVASRDGLIVTGKKNIDAGTADGQKFPIRIDGKDYSATYLTMKDGGSPLAFLKIGDSGQVLNAVTFGRPDDPKLGQTVVVLGGGDGNSVFKTTLSKFIYANTDSTTSPSQYLSAMETSPKIPEDNASGLVVNLDGQAVGIVVPNSDASGYLIYPVARILELIGAAPSQTAVVQQSTDKSNI